MPLRQSAVALRPSVTAAPRQLVDPDVLDLRRPLAAVQALQVPVDQGAHRQQDLAQQRVELILQLARESAAKRVCERLGDSEEGSEVRAARARRRDVAELALPLARPVTVQAVVLFLLHSRSSRSPLAGLHPRSALPPDGSRTSR